VTDAPKRKWTRSPEAKAKLEKAAELRAGNWTPDKVADAVAKGQPIPPAPTRSSPSVSSTPAPSGSQPEGSPQRSGGAEPSATAAPKAAADIPITNEVAAPKGGPAPASWYSESAVVEPTVPTGKVTSEDMDLGTGLLLDTVKMIHGWAADESGYEGWRLSGEEVELWRKVLKLILKFLPMKDWPAIAAIVALIVCEGKKFVGWTRYKKAKRGPTRPTKAPPEEDSRPVERPPQPPTQGAYRNPAAGDVSRSPLSMPTEPKPEKKGRGRR